MEFLKKREQSEFLSLSHQSKVLVFFREQSIIFSPEKNKHTEGVITEANIYPLCVAYFSHEKEDVCVYKHTHTQLLEHLLIQ